MIYSDLKDVYVGQLSEQETAEVSAYAKALYSAHVNGDTEKVASLLEEACTGLADVEAVEKIAALTVHCENYGHEKLAFASTALNAALVGFMATPYLRENAERRRKPQELDASIKAVFQERPDFFTPDKYDLTMRYFQTLANFAPDVAKNPMFAQNILDRYHRMGPALMDTNIIKELATTQASITDSVTKSKSALDPKQDVLLLLRQAGSARTVKP